MTAAVGAQVLVPVAEIVSVHPSRTSRTVTVRCPYCSELHRHGWPYGADEVGPRIAHCHPRRGDWLTYRVQAPEVTE